MTEFETILRNMVFPETLMTYKNSLVMAYSSKEYHNIPSIMNLLFQASAFIGNDEFHENLNSLNSSWLRINQVLVDSKRKNKDIATANASLATTVPYLPTIKEQLQQQEFEQLQLTDGIIENENIEMSEPKEKCPQNTIEMIELESEYKIVRNKYLKLKKNYNYEDLKVQLTQCKSEMFVLEEELQNLQTVAELCVK